MGKQTAPAETIQTGRDANGVPPVVGLGDGTTTNKGEFVSNVECIAKKAEMDAKLAAARPVLDEMSGKIDFTAKLRAVQAEQQQIVELPDGSVRVNIVVESEMVPVLESWAEGAGETFEEYLPKMISMGLQAIVLGGSVAG